jgi:hypothetical protein
MKVYTRTVMDMASGQLLEADSIEHSGSVAECKGGGGTQQTTQTTKQELDPMMKEFLGKVMGQSEAAYNRHMANPFNSMQQSAVTGMGNHLNSGQAFAGMNASNDLASNFLRRAGVQYNPGAYGMPQVDTASILNPAWSAAGQPQAPASGMAGPGQAPIASTPGPAAPPAGVLDDATFQRMFDVEMQRRQREEEERMRTRGGGGGH